MTHWQRVATLLPYNPPLCYHPPNASENDIYICAIV